MVGLVWKVGGESEQAILMQKVKKKKRHFLCTPSPAFTASPSPLTHRGEPCLLPTFSRRQHPLQERVGALLTLSLTSHSLHSIKETPRALEGWSWPWHYAYASPRTPSGERGEADPGILGLQGEELQAKVTRQGTVTYFESK